MLDSSILYTFFSLGVGFVRFANERDALNALDSIKNNPLLLADCCSPVEAKFADKHNPETRRRRHPMTSLLNVPNVNNLIGYPHLTLTDGNGCASQDALAAFLTGVPAHSHSLSSNSHNPLVNLQAFPTKNDYTHRLNHGVHPSKLQHHSSLNPMSSNSSSAVTTSSSANGPTIGIPDFGFTHAAAAAAVADSQLNALAAALIGAGNTQGFMSNCLRPPQHLACGTVGNMAPALNNGVISGNALPMFGPATPVSPADASLLDPK